MSNIKRNLIIVLVMALTGCNQQGDNNTGELNEVAKPVGITLTQAQIANAGIKYGKITRQILSQDVNAKGLLVVPYNAEADIVTFCEGVVKNVAVKVGSYVNEGQAMAIILSPEFVRKQQDFLAAKSNLDLWEEDYKRQEQLSRENVSSAKQFQQTQASYLEAKTSFDALRIEMEMIGIDFSRLENGEIVDKMILRSPIQGYVDEININIGKFVQPGQSLFKVINRRELYVELMIFEKDIMNIKPGQRVEFTLGNQEEIIYEAWINAVSSKVSPEAKIVKAIAGFENANMGLLPGMFVSAKIHTWEDTLDALPEEAILFDGKSTHYIYYTLTSMMESDKVSYYKARVEMGFVEEGFAQVSLLDELPDDAQIVIQGTYYIRSAEFQGEE